MLWMLTALVFAHKPFFGPFASPEEAYQVDPIDVSIVAYQYITCEENTLWMRFDGKAGDELYVQLGVPVIDRLADYRPSVAVFAPGLEPIGESPYLPPVTLPGQVYTANASPEDFFEPFTQTESWIWVEETLVLPEDGEGWIVAWHPENQTGKLWLAVGTREDFSDVGFDEFGTWAAYLNDFHEKTSQPNVPVETVCTEPEEPAADEGSGCVSMTSAPIWLMWPALAIAARRRMTHA